METSLTTGFAQIFSRCPKKSELPKIWGGGGVAAPLAPTARTPMAIGKQNLEEIPVQLSLINI